MPSLVVYDWSQFTTSLAAADLESDTHANDPAAPGYDPGQPSWVGTDFTFGGGAGSVIDINDDDGVFEDAYVETGGAQTLAAPVTINGTTYPAGSVVENEFSLLDAGGLEVWVVRIGGTNVGFAYPEGNPPSLGDVFTATDARDGDPLDSADGVSSSSEAFGNLICYAKGTQIDCAGGLRAVEGLRPGDLVNTLDQGPLPVAWIDHVTVDLSRVPPGQRAVLIRAGALGPDRPARDLVVSAQHRIVAGGLHQLEGLAQRPVFCPAKALDVLPGVTLLKARRRLTWCHFAFATHEVVLANGCWSESLLLGPMALKQMDSAKTRALLRIFERRVQGAFNGPAARRCLPVQETRRRVGRLPALHRA